MFLPKEKKSNNSKVLTEAEIKKKLYGEFETSSAGLNAASHEFKMSGSACASGTAKNPDPVSQRPFAVSQPGLSSSGPGKSAYEPSSARPSFSSTGSVSRSAGSNKAWKLVFVKGGRAVLGFLAGILWKLGAYFVRFLGFILKILDPRKPQARRILYSVTACVLVAALFIGVFRLNSQRKMAMMGELPPVTTQVTAVPAAVSPEVVTTTSSSDTDLTDATADAVQKEESQEMILKALENSSISPSSARTLPPATAGKYVIQVATYALLEDANRVIQSLTQAGFESFYKKQIRNSTGHSFYTVCLGRFESYKMAQDNLSKFRKAAVARPFQDAFIRTME